MNESKYPKSLSILLALNLCLLLTMLILSMDEIGDGAKFVTGMTGMQSIVLALGLGLIALPKAKGKRRGMLGILGVAIVAPVIILSCGHLLAESGGMGRTDQRVFTLLCFYAAAVPLLILSIGVVHDGWGANPNSVRRQCFLYLCFLLGVAGVVVNDKDLGPTSYLAIGFAMISQSLLLICLPIMKGCRLRLIGMGIVTIIGPIMVAVVADRIAKDQFNLRSGDRFDMVMLIFFAAAIVLSLLALFWLRHGWIAEEAKRKVGVSGNIVLALNLIAPLGLYALALGLTDGGLRDEGLLLLVPGWLFFAGLALMALGRAGGGLPPVKPLRGSGEMSFLIGTAMLSVAILIGETRGDERSLFVAIGFGLLGFLALHHVMRGFVSRWVRDSVQRFLFKWTVRGVPALIALAIVGVSAYYALGKTMANSALAKYKAASEAEGWSYDINDYIGEVPADDENFFMAKPFSGFLYTQNVGEKAVYLNPSIKTNVEAILDLRVFPRRRIPEKPYGASITKIVHLGDFADQLRVGEGRREAISPMEGTDREVIDQYFAQFDGLLRDLREAVKRPKQNFPYPFENGADFHVPHLAKFKGLTLVLWHSAPIKLARGDGGGAMEDVRLQFRLFEVTGSDIYLIGQLVHTAIGHIIVDGLIAGLHLGQWNDEQLAEWDKLLTLDKDYLKQWERCMHSERLMTTMTIESVINGETKGSAGEFIKDTRWIPRQWLVKDLIFYDTTMKQYTELIREAADTGRIDREKFNLHFSKAEATSEQKMYPFSRMMLPVMGNTMAKAGRLMNHFSAARLGIAIERYRRAKGDLPGDLGELVPDYIAALPIDTLTGKPLAWEHHGSPRYKISIDDTDVAQPWIYDAVLAAIHAGDLGQLKAFAEKGWKITRPEPGSTQPPESESDMAGMMMPGMSGKSKTIDFSASETEILSQQNALHHAVHSGNIEMLLWLIEQGVDTNGKAKIWTPPNVDESPGDDFFVFSVSIFDDSPQRTVLEFAVSEQDAEMVTALLDAGVLPIEADEEPESPATPDTPPGMDLPGMMGGMPGMMPGMMNPYGMMGMGMPGMGMPFPESPTAFELANTNILPLLLAKVPESLMPKAFEEGGDVSLLRKTLAKSDFAKARLLIARGADVNHPVPGTEPAKPDLGSPDNSGSPLGQGMVPGMMPGMMGMGMGMPGMNPYGMMMPGMMGMGMMEDTNKVELAELSVVSQAARVGDWAFFKLVIDRGADPKRGESDGSTPLHHAAANTDGAILKHLLTQQPDLEARDDADRTAAAHAAQAGLLDNLRQLEQAGANLNDSNLVNAAIRNLDRELIAHLIDSAKKPLDENWNRALPELEKIIRPEDYSGEPGNPFGMMNPMMMGMGMMPNRSPSRSLSKEELVANARAIATLLLENGLTSAKLKTPADITNLTRAKPEAESNE
ncbi:MAG: ankyrin repeat domain-containing protein [Verrucomicrobia bacterium]|nr:ankyrin repeat domain-containing protein [Verrucomicrobiota bacterium]